jgi:hypothetical protein
MEIGSPARVIIRLASDYDLTVVGAHDRYTRGKPGLGPAATRVVSSAPNAMLIGRGSPGDKVWRSSSSERRRFGVSSAYASR